MTTTFIISSIVYILLGGLLYLQRGGGILDFNTMLKKKGLPAPRNLVIVGLLELPIISMLYFYFNGNELLTSLYVGLSIGAGYIAYLVWGWGEYFDIGYTTREGYKAREILVIDWILYKIFGARWVQANPPFEVEYSFDVIPSPTGEIRDYDWRRKHDIVGMGLRMSLFAILYFAAIGLSKYFFLDASLFSSAIVLALSAPMFLIGFIYGIFKNKKAQDKDTEKALANQAAGKGEPGWNSTRSAEVATGIFLTLMTVIAYNL